MFSTVEPDTYEAISLDGLDLNEYVERFRVASGSQYKAETVGVYGRRIKNAMDAQAEYIATGKQAMLSRTSRVTKNGDAEEPAKQSRSKKTPAPATASADARGELIQFPFPLADGQMAQLNMPARLRKGDVDRLSAFLRTLQIEEQRQLPPGEEMAACQSRAHTGWSPTNSDRAAAARCSARNFSVLRRLRKPNAPTLRAQPLIVQ